MPTRLCDRCGQVIEDAALRYIAKIQVYAAYDPLNVDFEDMARDHTNDIEEILKRCEGMTVARG